MRKHLNLRANIALGLIFVFLANISGPICPIACSAEGEEFRLPAPGVRVGLSPEYNPPILKGLKVHPDNPFRFDFILDKGDSSGPLKTEATKLIKYFLASLTIPEKDLWVNLSPYEKDRIVPQSFGLTEMGRDLLAEDYILKQITASLIYPEGETGKRFWKQIYEETAKKFGTTNIPVNTFNKVWIVPEKAVVYENVKAGTAYVVESKLKVMLEQDYLALSHTVIPVSSSVIPAKAGIQKNDVNALGSQIVREIVIPELTKEVNEGKNFAQLRQVYNSLILATWYKKKIKDSILAQVYANKNKTLGLSFPNASVGNPEHIYQQYLQAFKKGAYNYIKEDIDPATQQTIPRKYLSGGVNFFGDLAMITTTESAMLPQTMDRAEVVEANIQPEDQAMAGERSVIGILENLRNSRGMGKTAFAKRIGISRRSYSRWMDGKYSPMFSIIVKIVKNSGLTPTRKRELFGQWLKENPINGPTKLSNILIEARIIHGLSRKELAEKIGLTPGTIFDYEIKGRIPAEMNCKNLANILELNKQELLELRRNMIIQRDIDENDMSLGGDIKKARLSRGLIPKQIVGVSMVYLLKIESGFYIPSERITRILAKQLGLDEGKLLQKRKDEIAFRDREMAAKQVTRLYYIGSGKDHMTPASMVNGDFSNVREVHMIDPVNSMSYVVQPYTETDAYTRVKTVKTKVGIPIDIFFENKQANTFNSPQTIEPVGYIVKIVGDSSSATAYASFYAGMIEKMKVGDYLLINTSFLRNDILNDKRSGLKKVSAQELGLKEGVVKSRDWTVAVSLSSRMLLEIEGGTPKLKTKSLPFVENGWVVFRKQREHDSDFINRKIEEDLLEGEGSFIIAGPGGANSFALALRRMTGKSKKLSPDEDPVAIYAGSVNPAMVTGNGLNKVEDRAMAVVPRGTKPDAAMHSISGATLHIDFKRIDQALDQLNGKVEAARGNDQKVQKAVEEFEGILGKFKSFSGTEQQRQTWLALMKTYDAEFEAISKAQETILIAKGYLTVNISNNPHSVLLKISKIKRHQTPSGVQIFLFLNNLSKYKVPVILALDKDNVLNGVPLDHFEPIVLDYIMPMIRNPEMLFFLEKPSVVYGWIGEFAARAMRKYLGTLDKKTRDERVQIITQALAEDYITINSGAIYNVAIAQGSRIWLALALLLEESVRSPKLRDSLKAVGLLDEGAMEQLVNLPMSKIRDQFSGYYKKLTHLDLQPLTIASLTRQQLVQEIFGNSTLPGVTTTVEKEGSDTAMAADTGADNFRHALEAFPILSKIQSMIGRNVRIDFIGVPDKGSLRYFFRTGVLHNINISLEGKDKDFIKIELVLGDERINLWANKSADGWVGTLMNKPISIEKVTSKLIRDRAMMSLTRRGLLSGAGAFAGASILSLGSRPAGAREILTVVRGPKESNVIFMEHTGGAFRGKMADFIENLEKSGVSDQEAVESLRRRYIDAGMQRFLLSYEKEIKSLEKIIGEFKTTYGRQIDSIGLELTPDELEYVSDFWQKRDEFRKYLERIGVDDPDGVVKYIVGPGFWLVKSEPKFNHLNIVPLEIDDAKAGLPEIYKERSSTYRALLAFQSFQGQKNQPELNQIEYSKIDQFLTQVQKNSGNLDVLKKIDPMTFFPNVSILREYANRYLKAQIAYIENQQFGDRAIELEIRQRKDNLLAILDKRTIEQVVKILPESKGILRADAAMTIENNSNKIEDQAMAGEDQSVKFGPFWEFISKMQSKKVDYETIRNSLRIAYELKAENKINEEGIFLFAEFLCGELMFDEVLAEPSIYNKTVIRGYAAASIILVAAKIALKFDLSEEGRGIVEDYLSGKETAEIAETRLSKLKEGAGRGEMRALAIIGEAQDKMDNYVFANRVNNDTDVRHVVNILEGFNKYMLSNSFHDSIVSKNIETLKEKLKVDIVRQGHNESISVYYGGRKIISRHPGIADNHAELPWWVIGISKYGVYLTHNIIILKTPDGVFTITQEDSSWDNDTSHIYKVRWIDWVTPDRAMAGEVRQAGDGEKSLFPAEDLMKGTPLWDEFKKMNGGKDLKVRYLSGDEQTILGQIDHVMQGVAMDDMVYLSITLQHSDQTVDHMVIVDYLKNIRHWNGDRNSKRLEESILKGMTENNDFLFYMYRKEETFLKNIKLEKISLGDRNSWSQLQGRGLMREVFAKQESILRKNFPEWTISAPTPYDLSALRFMERFNMKHPDGQYHMLVGRIPNDEAMAVQKGLPTSTGGIDLTPANMNLQTKREGGNDGGIKFHIDPAMLEQLQNAPGFVPVIINIQPMTDLKAFLGVTS